MNFKKKIFLIFTLFSIMNYGFSAEYGSPLPNLEPLKGTNVFVKIFFFFFPIANNYEFSFTRGRKSLTLDIDVKKSDIRNEPATPSIFDTDLKIKIQSIPLNQSGKFVLPITIRCNKKVNFKTGTLTVLNNGSVLIVKGGINELLIKDISDNEYFKKRFKWEYPVYFDLRFKLN